MAGKSLRRLQYECENLPEHDLADEEVVRYGKQMMVGVGVGGQRKLSQAKVLVAGVGATGSAVLLQLSAAGVGHIGVVDPSEFTDSNPAKEPIFAGAKPGTMKCSSAKDTITDLNPLVNVTVYPVSINDLDHVSIIPNYSLLICCTDDIRSRYRMSDLAVTYNKPLVMACALKTEGHCFVLNHQEGPCYRCLFPAPPSKFLEHQSDVGIFPGLKGIIGGIVAVEVLKIILGLEGLRQEVIVYDAMQGMITKHRMKGRQMDCIACGKPEFDINSDNYSHLVKPSKTLQELLTAVPDVNKMEAAQYFKDWEGKPHFILDVRVPIQFLMYHLPGAVNIPLGQLKHYIVPVT